MIAYRCLQVFVAVAAVGGASLHAQTALPSFSDLGVEETPELTVPAYDSEDGHAHQGRDMSSDPFVDDPDQENYSYHADGVHGEVVATPSAEHCHDPYLESYDLWDATPAVTESSGTWLRRGFWHAEAELVLYDRIWKKDDLLLATDGQRPPNIVPNVGVSFREFTLKGDGSADAAARFTLARFLFRDTKNRDHVASFTLFGGGHFEQDHTFTATIDSLNLLTAPGGNRLSVPFGIDGATIQTSNATTQAGAIQRFFDAFTHQGLDGAGTMRVRYTADFNSFEGNYQIKERMRKDRMVLGPDGHWARQASPTFNNNYLIGIRYFDFNERFIWNGFDIDSNLDGVGDNIDGEYDVETTNQLIGLQLGWGHTYDTGRWGIISQIKGGAFHNDARGRMAFARDDDGSNPNFATNPQVTPFNDRSAAQQISFMVEAKITGRWHLRPNTSLTAGAELLFLTAIATAPDNAGFVPDPRLAATSDQYYRGVTFGLEHYW